MAASGGVHATVAVPSRQADAMDPLSHQEGNVPVRDASRGAAAAFNGKMACARASSNWQHGTFLAFREGYGGVSWLFVRHDRKGRTLMVERDTLVQRLMLAMIEFDAGDPKRIHHFIKVHSLARTIGVGEGLVDPELLTLEAAAIVHDVGIHPAEKKYGSSDGKLQEKEGPAPAFELAEKAGFPPEISQRIAWLVGHHHTYHDIEGADYQILVEADFLVNLYEDGASEQAARSARERIFRTQTGIRLLDLMYGL